MFETGGSGQTVCRSCPHTLTTRDGKQRQQGSWNSGADPENHNGFDLGHS